MAKSCPLSWVGLLGYRKEINLSNPAYGSNEYFIFLQLAPPEAVHTFSAWYFRMALKVTLAKRMGRFVPTQTLRRGENEAGTLVHKDFEHKGVVIQGVPHDDHRVHSEVKDFMRARFYREAPIPRVLNLSEDSPAIRDFIDAEMNMYLGSGASAAVRRSKDNALVAVAFTAFWHRDPEYKVVGAKALDWHNTAAQLAKESSRDPRLVWRDLQFQHLYDLAQNFMTKCDRNYLLWAGCLSYDRSVRDQGLTDALMSNLNQRARQLRLAVGTQGNFEAFEPVVYRTFDNVTQVDQVRYEDEELEHSGERPFLRLAATCKNIKFYVALP